MRKITHVELLVTNQQEAVDRYTRKAGFKTVANMPFPGDPDNQWITIAPPDQTEV